MRAILGSALLVAVVSILSKITGFLRETTMAAVFGTAGGLNQYLLANIIPAVFVATFGGSLATAAIPALVGLREREGEQAERRLANGLLWLGGGLSLLLLVLAAVLLPLLRQWVAPGFHGASARQTQDLMAILIWSIPAWLFTGLLTGILQARRLFLFPAMVGVPMDLTLFAGLRLLGRRATVQDMALLTVAAIASQVLIQVPSLLRHRLLLRGWGRYRRELGRILLQSLPIAVTVLVAQSGPVIDQVLASRSIPGSISALTYAFLLVDLPLGIIGFSLVTVLYPALARAFHDADHYAESVATGLHLVWLFLAPFMVGLAMLGPAMVQVVYAHGAFGARSSSLTLWALWGFVPGLLPMATLAYCNRAFFARGEIRIPLLTGGATALANVLLGLLLLPLLPPFGLAVASSLASILGSAYALWELRRRVGLPLGSLRRAGGRLLAVTVLMGAVLWPLWQAILPHAHGKLSLFLDMLAVSLLGGAVYFGVLVLWKGGERELLLRVWQRSVE